MVANIIEVILRNSQIRCPSCIVTLLPLLSITYYPGCTGKSIVFMGDSAGGNLAIATAMRANSYGLRPPDGILAAYPVTYVKYAGLCATIIQVW